MNQSQKFIAVPILLVGLFYAIVYPMLGFILIVSWITTLVFMVAFIINWKINGSFLGYIGPMNLDKRRRRLVRLLMLVYVLLIPILVLVAIYLYQNVLPGDLTANFNFLRWTIAIAIGLNSYLFLKFPRGNAATTTESGVKRAESKNKWKVPF